MSLDDARLDAITLRLDSLHDGLLLRAIQLEKDADTSDEAADRMTGDGPEALGAMTGALVMATIERLMAHELRIIAEMVE